MTKKSLYPIVIVFDLDDTLYKEITFLRSAFEHILRTYNLSQHLDKFYQIYQQGGDAFDWLITEHLQQTAKEDLVDLYRYHTPNINLSFDAHTTLLNLALNPNVVLGLITDGRTRTQLNKIISLGIDEFIKDDYIVISERFGSSKPNPANYQYFMEKIQAEEYWYIGDNVQKDFVAPNRLNWKTICLMDDGNNIHSQNVNVDVIYQPQIQIHQLIELLPMVVRLLGNCPSTGNPDLLRH